MGASVFAVIPVHNGIEHTLPTVKSLLTLLPPEGRIVVVDDGSTDGTMKTLQKEGSTVTVLQGDGNLWWSGAINMGASFALTESADYILFLNNDIDLHPRFLEELLAGAREFPGSLIASKILSAEQPETIWSMGGKTDWKRGNHWMLGHGQRDDGRWEEPLEVDWLPGMSVLVPAAVFERGILVDQSSFPQYFGDSDFSMRTHNAGFRLIVWPASRVYNKVHNSGLDTRLVRGLESFSIRKFLTTLTSLKSSKCVPIYFKWLRRHAPLWSWPLMAGRFYGHYVLKGLQLWLGLQRGSGEQRDGSEDNESGYVSEASEFTER